MTVGVTCIDGVLRIVAEAPLSRDLNPRQISEIANSVEDVIAASAANLEYQVMLQQKRHKPGANVTD